MKIKVSDGFGFHPPGSVVHGVQKAGTRCPAEVPLIVLKVLGESGWKKRIQGAVKIKENKLIGLGVHLRGVAQAKEKTAKRTVTN